jgi:hypothetical protein
LDCRTAGLILGISHVLAWKWFRLLKRDKVLDCITTGHRGKASEWRYLPAQQELHAA